MATSFQINRSSIREHRFVDHGHRDLESGEVRLDVDFVALTSNTHKTEALLESCGLGSRLFTGNLEKMEPDALWEKYATFTSQELKQLQKLIEHNKKSAGNMFDKLAG